jgi:hypothetical protein
MDGPTRRSLLQALLCLWPGLAAGGGPPLVCGQAPPPAFPPPDKPPIVQSWLQDGRQDGPLLPDCGHLRGREFELLVRVTASFNAPGEAADMLLRMGAVSSMKGMTYWSFSDRRRQLLVRESFAVEGPTSTKPRADFTLAELRSGALLHYLQSDNRTSALVPYSLKVLLSGNDGFTLRIENLADVRFMGVTFVPARAMQWVVTIERLGPERWGYRSLLGVQQLGFGSAEKYRLSNLSRSVAIFDLLSGRQTEIESMR